MHDGRWLIAMAIVTAACSSASEPTSTAQPSGRLTGTEFETATEANLVNDVIEVCDFVETQPDTWKQWYDDFGDVASRRIEALGSTLSQTGLAAFLDEVEARMETVCPDQAAYLVRLVDKAELDVSEQEMPALIIHAWELFELPDPWSALPNEAFAVENVRESMADFCAQLDSGEGFDEATSALPTLNSDRVRRPRFVSSPLANQVELCDRTPFDRPE